MDDNKLLWVVSIVAMVGIVAMVMGVGRSTAPASEDYVANENLAGQAGGGNIVKNEYPGGYCYTHYWGGEIVQSDCYNTKTGESSHCTNMGGGQWDCWQGAAQ